MIERAGWVAHGLSRGEREFRNRILVPTSQEVELGFGPSYLRLFSQKRTGNAGLTMRLAGFSSTKMPPRSTRAPGTPSPRRRPHRVAGAASRRRSGRGSPGSYGAEAEASSGLTPVVRGAVASAYETDVPRCAFRRRTVFRIRSQASRRLADIGRILR